MLVPWRVTLDIGLGDLGLIDQKKQNLVDGWTNPFEKYARQIGSWNPK